MQEESKMWGLGKRKQHITYQPKQKGDTISRRVWYRWSISNCTTTKKNEVLLNIQDIEWTDNNTSTIFNIITMWFRRTHISYIADNYNHDERVSSQCRTTNQQLRPPFAVLVQNFDNVGNSHVQCHNTTKESTNDGKSSADFSS